MPSFQLILYSLLGPYLVQYSCLDGCLDNCSKGYLEASRQHSAYLTLSQAY